MRNGIALAAVLLATLGAAGPVFADPAADALNAAFQLQQQQAAQQQQLQMQLQQQQQQQQQQQAEQQQQQFLQQQQQQQANAGVDGIEPYCHAYGTCDDDGDPRRSGPARSDLGAMLGGLFAPAPQPETAYPAGPYDRATLSPHRHHRLHKHRRAAE